MRRTKFAFLAVLCLLAATTAFGRQLPNIDKLGEAKPTAANAALLNQRAAGLVQKGMPLSAELRLGVPTFLWPSPLVAQLPAGLKPITDVTGGAVFAAPDPAKIGEIFVQAIATR